MQLKPIYEVVNCGPLGYDDIDVMVRVNPNGKMVKAYTTAQGSMIEAQIELNMANELVQFTDGNDEAAFEAAKARFDKASKAVDKREADYENAIAGLIHSVKQGDEEMELPDRKALNAFAEDFDIHIIRYALQQLWDIRNGRVQTARVTFRGDDSGSPAEGNGATSA